MDDANYPSYQNQHSPAVTEKSVCDENLDEKMFCEVIESSAGTSEDLRQVDTVARSSCDKFEGTPESTNSSTLKTGCNPTSEQNIPAEKKTTKFDRQFICKVCGFQAMSLLRLSKHSLAKHLCCKKCLQFCESQATLEQHEKYCPALSCAKCRQCFRTSVSLSLHQLRCTGEHNSAPYTCFLSSKCQTTCSSYDLLLEHSWLRHCDDDRMERDQDGTISQKNLGIYRLVSLPAKKTRCQICGQKMDNIFSFLKHHSDNHKRCGNCFTVISDDTHICYSYNCPKCNQKFKSFVALVVHCFSCDGKNTKTPFRCITDEACSSTFGSYAELVEHYQNKHMNQRPAVPHFVLSSSQDCSRNQQSIVFQSMPSHTDQDFSSIEKHTNKNGSSLNPKEDDLHSMVTDKIKSFLMSEKDRIINRQSTTESHSAESTTNENSSKFENVNTGTSTESEQQSGSGCEDKSTQPTSQTSEPKFVRDYSCRCVICDYLATDRTSLRKHVIKDHPHCDRCYKPFETAKARDKHMKSCKFFQCNKCTYSFSTFQEFSEHYMRCPGDGLPVTFICGNNCSYVAHTLEILETHLKVKHRQKPHRCNECGKKFPTVTCLRTHSQKRHPVKLLECCVCQMEFHSIKSRERHEASYSDNGLRCKKCSLTLGNRDEYFKHNSSCRVDMKNLDQHLKPHDSPVNVYSCDFCSFRHNRFRGLQKHIWQKHPDKLDSCKRLNPAVLNPSSLLTKKTRVHPNLRMKESSSSVVTDEDSHNDDQCKTAASNPLNMCTTSVTANKPDLIHTTKTRLSVTSETSQACEMVTSSKENSFSLTTGSPNPIEARQTEKTDVISVAAEQQPMVHQSVLSNNPKDVCISEHERVSVPIFENQPVPAKFPSADNTTHHNLPANKPFSRLCIRKPGTGHESTVEPNDQILTVGSSNPESFPLSNQTVIFTRPADSSQSSHQSCVTPAVFYAPIQQFSEPNSLPSKVNTNGVALNFVPMLFTSNSLPTLLPQVTNAAVKPLQHSTDFTPKPLRRLVIKPANLSPNSTSSSLSSALLKGSDPSAVRTEKPFGATEDTLGLTEEKAVFEQLDNVMPSTKEFNTKHLQTVSSIKNSGICKIPDFSVCNDFLEEFLASLVDEAGKAFYVLVERRDRINCLKAMRKPSSTCTFPQLEFSKFKHYTANTLCAIATHNKKPILCVKLQTDSSKVAIYQLTRMAAPGDKNINFSVTHIVPVKKPMKSLITGKVLECKETCNLPQSTTINPLNVGGTDVQLIPDATDNLSKVPPPIPTKSGIVHLSNANLPTMSSLIKLRKTLLNDDNLSSNELQSEDISAEQRTHDGVSADNCLDVSSLSPVSSSAVTPGDQTNVGTTINSLDHRDRNKCNTPDIGDLTEYSDNDQAAKKISVKNEPVSPFLSETDQHPEEIFYVKTELSDDEYSLDTVFSTEEERSNDDSENFLASVPRSSERNDTDDGHCSQSVLNNGIIKHEPVVKPEPMAGSQSSMYGDVVKQDAIQDDDRSDCHTLAMTHILQSSQHKHKNSNADASLVLNGSAPPTKKSDNWISIAKHRFACHLNPLVMLTPIFPEINQPEQSITKPCSVVLYDFMKCDVT